MRIRVAQHSILYVFPFIVLIPAINTIREKNLYLKYKLSRMNSFNHKVLRKLVWARRWRDAINDFYRMTRRERRVFVDKASKQLKSIFPPSHSYFSDIHSI